MNNNLVSIVMRTVGRRPREIRRAIASIVANADIQVELIIVFQGCEDEQLADIQNLPKEFPSLTINIAHNFHIGDRRAENLNIGWEKAKGRYIGFLDDDDTLEVEHLTSLVHAIKTSGRTWAYSQVKLRMENESLHLVTETHPFRRHCFSLKTLWTENFLPIHSFLIDRTGLHHSLQRNPFYEFLDRSEDWDFLLRLAFHHEPIEIKEFTCTYHINTSNQNTNLSLMNSSANDEQEQINKDAWLRCKTIIDQRKEELITPLWWARDYLYGKKTMTLEEKSLRNSTQTITIHQRIIRKLIRILEGLL